MSVEQHCLHVDKKARAEEVLGAYILTINLIVNTVLAKCGILFSKISI